MLLGDPELRSEMGAAARRYAEENFSIADVADRFETVFRRAVGESA